MQESAPRLYSQYRTKRNGFMDLLIVDRMQIQPLKCFDTINQVMCFVKISVSVLKLLSFMYYLAMKKYLSWILVQLKALWIFPYIKLCNS